MNNIRIIPRIDIKGPNVVKGIHLEGLRVLGKPEAFAKFYYQNGADELFYQDVVASLYERNSLKEIISRTAKEVLIPLTVGGGLRTINDINDVLRAGADKVSLNTAVTKNPELIKQASKKFGSSTIVVAIEAIKGNDGKYYAFIDNGREETGLEVVTWAKQVQDLGAGEIVITSVDKEGTGEGFDLELTNLITEAVEIPVIAHGGAGNLTSIKEVICKTGVDAVAISSIFHYFAISEISQDIWDENEGNLAFRKSGKKYNLISPIGIRELKSFLKENEINHRPFIL
jgi:cyclase